jgi:hypothetical protein
MASMPEDASISGATSAPPLPEPPLPEPQLPDPQPPDPQPPEPQLPDPQPPDPQPPEPRPPDPQPRPPPPQYWAVADEAVKTTILVDAMALIIRLCIAGLRYGQGVIVTVGILLYTGIIELMRASQGLCLVGRQTPAWGCIVSASKTIARNNYQYESILLDCLESNQTKANHPPLGRVSH